MSIPQKIIVSVSSDLSTDQRVQKVCTSLANHGFDVQLLGRKLTNSSTFSSNLYKAKRFTLWFNRGFLFYANLNVALFFKLLFSKFDVLYANDLDTLTANFLVSKITGKPLIYDSHEYFTEVPELVSRPSVQRIWVRIEKTILPKLKNCITVTEQIANVYKEKYQADFAIMRNFPVLQKNGSIEKENYILYQGALNIGRGLEELIAAMPFVNAKLWIAGAGDVEQKLKQVAGKLSLSEKVIFLGRLDPKVLKEYTEKAKLGISIEHKMGLNYTYALPNKIFDYIHCQTPVLYADLVEVKRVLNGVEIGQELKSYDLEILANQINEMLTSPNYIEWHKNCEVLRKELNWQEEEKVLLKMIQNLE